MQTFGAAYALAGLGALAWLWLSRLIRNDNGPFTLARHFARNSLEFLRPFTLVAAAFSLASIAVESIATADAPIRTLLALEAALDRVDTLAERYSPSPAASLAALSALYLIAILPLPPAWLDRWKKLAFGSATLRLFGRFQAWNLRLSVAIATAASFSFFGAATVGPAHALAAARLGEAQAAAERLEQSVGRAVAKEIALSNLADALRHVGIDHFAFTLDYRNRIARLEPDLALLKRLRHPDAGSHRRAVDRLAARYAPPDEASRPAEDRTALRLLPRAELHEAARPASLNQLVSADLSMRSHVRGLSARPETASGDLRVAVENAAVDCIFDRRWIGLAEFASETPLVKLVFEVLQNTLTDSVREGARAHAARLLRAALSSTGPDDALKAIAADRSLRPLADAVPLQSADARPIVEEAEAELARLSAEVRARKEDALKPIRQGNAELLASVRKVAAKPPGLMRPGSGAEEALLALADALERVADPIKQGIFLRQAAEVLGGPPSPENAESLLEAARGAGASISGLAALQHAMHPNYSAQLNKPGHSTSSPGPRRPRPR